MRKISKAPNQKIQLLLSALAFAAAFFVAEILTTKAQSHARL